MIEIRAAVAMGMGIDLKGTKETLLGEEQALDLPWVGLHGCKHLSKHIKFYPQDTCVLLSANLSHRNIGK